MIPARRPVLIPDRSAYRQRLQGWLHSTDLAKVSRADLAWLYPGERCESVARRRLELGPALVVVTCGADGCSAFTRSRALNMPAGPVEGADPGGAGDSVAAGLLAWLYQHGALTPSRQAALSEEDLAVALGYAAAAAALTCARPAPTRPTRPKSRQPCASARAIPHWNLDPRPELPVKLRRRSQCAGGA